MSNHNPFKTDYRTSTIFEQIKEIRDVLSSLWREVHRRLDILVTNQGEIDDELQKTMDRVDSLVKADLTKRVEILEKELVFARADAHESFYNTELRRRMNDMDTLTELITARQQRIEEDMNDRVGRLSRWYGEIKYQVGQFHHDMLNDQVETVDLDDVFGEPTAWACRCSPEHNGLYNNYQDWDDSFCEHCKAKRPVMEMRLK